MTPSTTSPGSVPDTRQEFKRGLTAAVPVLVGLVPFALVLGAQAGQKQLSAAEVPLMAGLNFAGGSEFAAVQLWTSPPHLLLIAAVTLLVNSRHLVMGAAFAPLIRHLPRRKALALLFTLCDETWAMGLADADRAAAGGAPRRLSLPYYIGVSSALWLAWVSLTALGAGVGPLLGDLQAYGFDLAFPAVVLVLARNDAEFAKLPIARHPRILTAVGGAARAGEILLVLLGSVQVEQAVVGLVEHPTERATLAPAAEPLKEAVLARLGQVLPHGREAAHSGRRAMVVVWRFRRWTALRPLSGGQERHPGDGARPRVVRRPLRAGSVHLRAPDVERRAAV